MSLSVTHEPRKQYCSLPHIILPLSSFIAGCIDCLTLGLCCLRLLSPWYPMLPLLSLSLQRTMTAESFCASLKPPVYLLQGVNTSWPGLCETLHYQERFGRPLRLPHCTICVRIKTCAFASCLKFTSDFALIIFSNLHNNPMRQSHNDYIYIIQRGNWILVWLINLAKVP